MVIDDAITDWPSSVDCRLVFWRRLGIATLLGPPSRSYEPLDSMHDLSLKRIARAAAVAACDLATSVSTDSVSGGGWARRIERVDMDRRSRSRVVNEENILGKSV